MENFVRKSLNMICYCHFSQDCDCVIVQFAVIVMVYEMRWVIIK